MAGMGGRGEEGSVIPLYVGIVAGFCILFVVSALDLGMGSGMFVAVIVSACSVCGYVCGLIDGGRITRAIFEKEFAKLKREAA